MDRDRDPIGRVMVTTTFWSLRESDLPADRLAAEITEIVMPHDTEATLATPHRLRAWHGGLIANTYDHVSSDGLGTIAVSLVRGDPDGDATLVFSDDGVGFIDAGGNKPHGLS
jgi:hypothetical protein